MTKSKWPFNRPPLAGQEVQYMSHAIELAHIFGDSFSKRREAFSKEWE